MSVKLYMDVHVPHAITLELRRRQVDVLTAHEDGRSQADDATLLARATALGRVLFTRDADLLVIGVAWQRAGMAFAGILYAHQLRASIGRCTRDLELIAKSAEPSELANRIEHLPL